MSAGIANLHAADEHSLQQAETRCKTAARVHAPEVTLCNSPRLHDEKDIAPEQ